MSENGFNKENQEETLKETNSEVVDINDENDEDDENIEDLEYELSDYPPERALAHIFFSCSKFQEEGVSRQAFDYLQDIVNCLPEVSQLENLIDILDENNEQLIRKLNGLIDLQDEKWNDILK